MKNIFLYFIFSLSFLFPLEIYIGPGFHTKFFTGNVSVLTERWDSDHPEYQSAKYSNVYIGHSLHSTIDYGLMNRGKLFFNKNLDTVIGLNYSGEVFPPYNYSGSFYSYLVIPLKNHSSLQLGLDITGGQFAPAELISENLTRKFYNWTSWSGETVSTYYYDLYIEYALCNFSIVYDKKIINKEFHSASIKAYANIGYYLYYYEGFNHMSELSMKNMSLSFGIISNISLKPFKLLNHLLKPKSEIL